MRRLLAAALAVVPTVATGRAVADDLPRLILDSGRTETPAPDPDAYRFLFHGELQIRYQVERSFPLVASASAAARAPGLVEQSIGQNQFLSHWLRLSPRLQLRDTVELVAQLDLLTGVIAGDLARDTGADQTPRNAYNGFSNVQPRWLYAQWRLPFGMVRIGQQPNHWGMGVLYNDGEHPLLFGDYRYGAISERILFATKPGGKDSDFNLSVAGDLVFRDNIARLTRGQQAYQGVLAAYYEHDRDKLGVFTTFRHQENDRTSATPLFTYSDVLDTVSIDLHGKIARAVPGESNALVFAEAEAAYVLGSTNFVRTTAQALGDTKAPVRAYGGAATVGVVHRTSSGEDAFGDIVGQVEVGYASGDADPYDGTYRRFTFDPNHRIGLMLFDEVMRFQTARAATAATDPLVARQTPGVDLIPSNGGVFGAQYINPTAIYRPRRWLDLKGGMVVAQATSDIVDPYRLAVSGSYVNYRGGDPKKKDLGVELDAGVEARVPLEYGMTAQIGAQGGVLFPGGALADASGARLHTPWLFVGRFGVLF
jgi:hypothetical protein